MFSNNQINIDELPKVETLDFKPIAKSYFKIILFNLIITFTSVIAVLFVLRALILEGEYPKVFWSVIALLVFLFFISLGLNKLGFKTRKYALREKDITYTHGYISNSTTTLPFNRIQHLEISRSFLARKLGLSTLKIYSAGESGGDLSIKGLPKDTAESQYAFLTTILNERI